MCTRTGIVSRRGEADQSPARSTRAAWSNVGDRLTHMDKSGIDVEALSINPFWYRAERRTRNS